MGASIIGGHFVWPKGREESPDTKLGIDDISLPGPYLIGGMHGSCSFRCRFLDKIMSWY